MVGSLSIHLPSLSVTLDGRRLDLTRRETELLYTLASAPGPGVHARQPAHAGVGRGARGQLPRGGFAHQAP